MHLPIGQENEEDQNEYDACEGVYQEQDEDSQPKEEDYHEPEQEDFQDANSDDESGYKKAKATEKLKKSMGLPTSTTIKQ